MVKRSKGLDFVIVDYDQLVIRASLSGRDDEFKAQARFMADALALAKRLDICFILLCQPHKLDEDVARGRKPPWVDQIFGSSAVANTAHHILWVVREYFKRGMDVVYERLAKVYVLKARNDKTSVIEIGLTRIRCCLLTSGMNPSQRKQRNSKRPEKSVSGEYGHEGIQSGASHRPGYLALAPVLKQRGIASGRLGASLRPSPFAGS
jgi:hypothetical protein